MTEFSPKPCSRSDLSKTESPRGGSGLLPEAPCHSEEQFPSHVPAGQPVSHC